MSQDYLTASERRAKRLEESAKRRMLEAAGGPPQRGLTDAARQALESDEATPAQRERDLDESAAQRVKLESDAYLEGCDWQPEDHDGVTLPLTEYMNGSRLNYDLANIAVGSDKYVPESEGGDGRTLPLDSEIQRVVTRGDYLERTVISKGRNAGKVRYVKRPGKTVLVTNDKTGKPEPVAQSRGYVELRKVGLSGKGTKHTQYWSKPTERDALRTDDDATAEPVAAITLTGPQLDVFAELVQHADRNSSFDLGDRWAALIALRFATPDDQCANVATFSVRDYAKIRKECRKTFGKRPECAEVLALMP